MAASMMAGLALSGVGAGVICILLAARLVRMGSRIEGYVPTVGRVTTGTVAAKRQGGYIVALWYQYGADGMVMRGSNMVPGSHRAEFLNEAEAQANLAARIEVATLDVLFNPRKPDEALLPPTPARRWAQTGAIMGGFGVAILYHAMMLWVTALGGSF